MGEACLRANISHGDGVYKSTDAGKTWNNVGLRDSSQIGKICGLIREIPMWFMSPPSAIRTARMKSAAFSARAMAARSWQKILYINDKTGAVDIAMDPRDPLTLYATTWQVLRTPWEITSIGPGSGIYKTTDGGDHWTQLKDGLPKGDKGKIGITVSPVNSNRVWATVEAEDGGIYRSDDGGESWQQLNDEFELRSRQYYYGHIFADSQQADTLYVFSSKHFLKSTDGGKTYTHIETPHGDYHDLWIDPHDNQRMVDGNDGGAIVTFNGGKSWSTVLNQPTAQIYTVSADNGFPYHVYGAQQDNTTLGIASRTSGPGIGLTDWYEVGGGESGYVEPDPEDPDIIYAGSFWGILTRYDHRTGSVRNISAWPDFPGGPHRRGNEISLSMDLSDRHFAGRAGNNLCRLEVLFRNRPIDGQSWQANQRRPYAK